MARKNLFEYAILYHPKQTKDGNGNDTTAPDEVVQAITSVLARDDKEVQIIAARAIPDKHLEHLDDIEIISRPL